MSAKEVGVLQSSLQALKDRFGKVLRQRDLASQKAKMLHEQAERDRRREDLFTQLITQLVERQRELNVMLNRANLMLSRAQETNAILSIEFTELCHALPAPEDPEVRDRIRRINDMFKNTGTEEAEVTVVNAAAATSRVAGSGQEPSAPDSPPAPSSAPAPDSSPAARQESPAADIPVSRFQEKASSNAEPAPTPRPVRPRKPLDGMLITPPPATDPGDTVETVLGEVESDLTQEAVITSSDVARVLDDLFRRTGDRPPKPERAAEPQPVPEPHPEPTASAVPQPERGPQPEPESSAELETEPNGQDPSQPVTETSAPNARGRRWWQQIGKS